MTHRRITHLRAIGALCCAAILPAFMPACASDPSLGYTLRSTYPSQYSTVAVEIFDNETFDRDVEFDLADALVKEIESRTPYKVTYERRADTILTGRIARVERDQISRSRDTGLGEEVLYIVTVDFTWRDARSDAIIVERRDFTADSLFLPSPPHGEPIELARFAVAQELARDIVDEMRGDW